MMNQIKYIVSQFSVVFLLGFLSGLPQSLFSTTLQAWFIESGFSIGEVSNLGLLYLVFFLRIFWGPICDRFYFHQLGRRRTWIISSQLGLFLVIEFLALIHPVSNYHSILLLSLILAIMSSIQDLVIDAHRIEYLSPSQFGLGAVVAVYGYRIALLVSGGGALLLAHYYSFNMAYALMGLLFLFGALIVYFSQEPLLVVHPSTQSDFWKPYLELFELPWCKHMIGMVFCLKFGEVFVSNSSILIMPFLMKGLGLTLPKIAFINKVVGFGAQLMGGAFAAFLIMRYKALVLLLSFGLMLALSNLGFWCLSSFHYNESFLYVVIIFENFASGLTTTALVALLMKIVNPQYTASQFSFWVIFGVVPRIMAAPLVGVLFPHTGWSGLFLLSTLICASFVYFWFKVKKQLKVT